MVTPAGVTTTLAGGSSQGDADGAGTAASFFRPVGIALNWNATKLWVADNGNNLIRQIIIATGVVTTLAGSGTAAWVDAPGTSASFSSPYGIAVRAHGPSSCPPLCCLHSTAHHIAREVVE